MSMNGMSETERLILENQSKLAQALIALGGTCNPSGRKILSDICADVITSTERTLDADLFAKALHPVQKSSLADVEEVYSYGYDTAGNYHWVGVKTGEHIY